VTSPPAELRLRRAAEPDRGMRLLLRAAVHADADVALRAWDTLVSDAGSADGVIAWADAGVGQRLLPALAERTELLELPLTVTQRLRARRVEAWGLNERLLMLSEPSIRSLVEAGVRTLGLKGVALLGDVIPRHATRPLGDLDLLVAPGDVRAALGILADAGWTTGMAPRRLLTLATHAVNLGLMTTPGPSLDLHWRAASTLSPSARRQRRSMGVEDLPPGHPLAATGLRRPRPEHLVLQIAVNGLKPDTPSPHWIADLGLLLRRRSDLDGDLLRHLSIEEGVDVQVRVALRIVADVLDVHGPPSHRPRALRAADERHELRRAVAPLDLVELTGRRGPQASWQRLVRYTRVRRRGAASLMRSLAVTALLLLERRVRRAPRPRR
jgi:hypothetical protein